MTARPLLDTHAWVWWLLGDGRLKRGEREALDAFPSGRRPVLCDISLWEMAMLVELGRVRLESGLEGWLSTAASPATVALQGITPAIVASLHPGLGPGNTACCCQPIRQPLRAERFPESMADNPRISQARRAGI